MLIDIKCTLCIYHSHCIDGFTSAYVVWKKYGDRVTFVPARYDDVVPDVRGQNVIIVDFFYNKNQLVKLVQQAESVVIIDHHKTTIETIQKNMQELLYAANMPNNHRQTGIGAFHPILDSAHCSSYLTWNAFFAEDMPNLIRYVEDQGNYKLYSSRFINAFISSWNYEFPNWKIIEENLNDSTIIQNLAISGSTILRKHEKDVRDTLKIAKRKMVIGGHEVWVVNVPLAMANVANEIMSENEKFSATYIDLAEKREFILRSRSYGIDVEEIAKLYGGGGSEHLAGFKMPIGWEGDNA